MNIDQRIAALEAELAALKAERPAPAPAAQKDEQGARVIQLNDEITSGLPSLDQLRKLFSIVRNKVPQVKSHDDDAAFRGFTAAYRFVANCGRLTAPNPKVTIGWWCDEMKAWSRARNAMTIDLNGSSFIAAVLASGDVIYVPFNGDLGHAWEVGLLSPSHNGGTPATDAWKTVLSTGNVRAPSSPARQVRIVSG